MSASPPKSAAIVPGGTSVALTSLFRLPTSTVTSAAPVYVVVCGLDRNEYTANATGATGAFTGNGQTQGFSSIGGDGRGAGIVFTYQPTTGQYTNSTFGALASLALTASSSTGDVTNISLFAESSPDQAQAYANNAYALMQTDPSGYLGSATVVTNPNFTGTVPSQATPNSIAAAAQNFVGDAWNMDGCWVLASTIAAVAGASLPVQTTAVGVPGAANGEWYTLYNGPAAGALGDNWQNLVSTGDVVDFVTASGGGHVTTCVSGSGATAQLIDNITYEYGDGTIANPAGDGSANDILVSPAHAASQEFAGAPAQDVVIYALDTPVVTDASGAGSAATGTLLQVSKLASAADPEGHAITEYQAYDSLSGATFTTGAGAGTAAHSAAAAVTVASLTNLDLSYTSAGTDTVEIRAFNGTYWGDWQADTINVATGSSATPSAPRLALQTAAQTWVAGSRVALSLPAGTFTDPQNQALTYSATGLPSWLTFNAGNRTFSGKAPTATGSLSFVVTAKDTAGLSTSETITATISATAPIVAAQTAGQSWTEGGKIFDTLPAGTFSDPQMEALTFNATLSNGAALPTWLKFNTRTDTFSGTAPNAAATLALKVTATDTSNLSVYEIFTATVAAASAGTHGFLAVSAGPGPAQNTSSGPIGGHVSSPPHWEPDRLFPMHHH